jgi:hypothetical protein
MQLGHRPRIQAMRGWRRLAVGAGKRKGRKNDKWTQRHQQRSESWR